MCGISSLGSVMARGTTNSWVGELAWGGFAPDEHGGHPPSVACVRTLSNLKVQRMCRSSRRIGGRGTARVNRRSRASPAKGGGGGRPVSSAARNADASRERINAGSAVTRRGRIPSTALSFFSFADVDSRSPESAAPLAARWHTSETAHPVLSVLSLRGRVRLGFSGSAIYFCGISARI